jgi:hypothetical protein
MPIIEMVLQDRTPQIQSSSHAFLFLLFFHSHTYVAYLLFFTHVHRPCHLVMMIAANRGFRKNLISHSSLFRITLIQYISLLEVLLFAFAAATDTACGRGRDISFQFLLIIMKYKSSLYCTTSNTDYSSTLYHYIHV